MRSIKARLAGAAKHERKLRKKIERAVADGADDSADRFACAYLRSFDAKLVAAYAVNQSLRGNRKPVPKEQLLAVASKIDPWQPCDEPVVVHAKPKKGNELDFRLVASFGIEQKARQHLVASILKVRASVDERQYAVTGGGRNAAVEAVKRSLAEGLSWAAEIDLQDCYHSFNEEAVPKMLPLPKTVAENVVISCRHNLALGNIFDWFGHERESEEVADALREARRGIAQGSVTSPLVAEILLARAFDKLPNRGRVVAYADNFLVTTRTKNDVVFMTKALCDALHELPAGPLRPKVRYIRHASKGFDFLGYRLSTADGIAVAAPTDANLQKHRRHLQRELASARRLGLTPTDKRGQVRRLKGHIRSWTAAFPL